jgi:beta-N-acetylhexosaminidase
VAVTLLNRMSLEQRIGQLFVVPVWGQSADETHPGNQLNHGVDTPAQVVERHSVGGVIYVNHAATGNLDNPRQVASLSNGLQRAATSSGAHLPLIIAIDQEGGSVTRLESRVTELPGSMAIGAGGSPSDARALATISARELRALGVNLNLAPVADVNSNPANPIIGARSFSSQPELASQLVAAQVTGFQSSGPAGQTVASAAKHFPGHGDTATDSHVDLPVINRTEQQWRQIDLPPFQAAINAGADSIMTAHIQVPSLDPTGTPATLSRPILTGLLRDQLSYRGVIVTDALGMSGANVLPPAQVPLRAIEAGADILLMPPDLDLAKSAVLSAVRSGRISEQRINDSVLRILQLKLKRAILSRPLVDLDKVASLVGTPANLAEVQRISDATATVLRNDAGLLPLRSAPATVLVTGVGDTRLPASSPTWLAGRITARGSAAIALPTGANPGQDVVTQAVTVSAGADLIVVLTNNLGGRAEQRALLRRLLATGKPVVAVASQVPYDAAVVEAPTWIASYTWRAVSMESLARVLFGEVSPRGRLPVDIPAGGDLPTVRHPFGTGLSW